MMEDIPISVVRLGLWGEIRRIRDYQLRASDWTQTYDCPLSDEKKKAWADYRQALRDIPNVYDNPDDVVWPTKPE